MPQARKAKSPAVQAAIDGQPAPDPSVPLARREVPEADRNILPSGSNEPRPDVAVDELSYEARKEMSAWCRLQVERARHRLQTDLHRLGIADRNRDNVRIELLNQMAMEFDPHARPK